MKVKKPETSPWTTGEAFAFHRWWLLKYGTGWRGKYSPMMEWELLQGHLTP